VLRPVNKCSIADAAFDLIGGFGPTEGFGVFVPVGQEAGDGLLQARDAVEAAAANGLRGDQAEPALDQVEPRGAGRGEVQMEARVGGQPLFDRGMLVGPVVVTDQMQLQLGIALGQRLQEDDELGVPMAPVATPTDLAAGHLQRGEQAGSAVAQESWVMRAGSSEAEIHRLEGELLLRRDESGAAEAHGCFLRAIEVARQ
jgi:hypothetical protein